MAYCSKRMFARGRDSLVPVPKCPRDTSALGPNCPDISSPAKVSWVRSVWTRIATTGPETLNSEFAVMQSLTLTLTLT